MMKAIYVAVCVLTIAWADAVHAQTAGTPPSSEAEHQQHQAADSPPSADSGASDAKTDTKTDTKMSPQHMQMRHKMMADMQARAADLEALRVRMNETDGDARIDAIVALLNALVRNHAEMHEHMMKMHSSMDRAREPAR